MFDNEHDFWIELSRFYIGEVCVWCLYQISEYGGARLLLSSTDINELKGWMK